MMLFFLDIGLSFIQVGTLYAFRELMINLMEIPSGLVADTFGRRRVMVFSFASYVLAFVIFYFSQHYWLLFFAMTAYAGGDAFRTGTHKAMIFDYLNAKSWQHMRTHYYGRTRSWSKRGSALSALIAAGLVFWQGSYAPVFLFSIIPYTLDLLLVLSYPEYLDGPRHTSNRTARDEFAHVFQSLVVTLRDSSARRAIANQSLFSGYFKACKDYLQPILRTFALGLPVMLTISGEERTAIVIGVVFSLIYMVAAIASRRSGSLVDRFNGDAALPLNGILAVGSLVGIGSGLAYARELVAPAVVLFVVIYGLESLRKPIGISYVTERMDAGSLASTLSVESQAETLFAATFALLLGLIASVTNIGVGLSALSGAVLLLGFILRLPGGQKQ
jgi:MFS family permease